MYPTSIFHFSDSSLYNLVLSNTVIIVYKLTYHSDITECAFSPILCYVNVHFGYKTSDASNLPVTADRGEINGNRLLAYVAYVYTVLVFLLFHVCRVISRKHCQFINFPVHFFCEEKAALSVLLVCCQQEICPLSYS